MTIGENIRRARQAAGQSQHQLALALGVTDRTPARWEAGENTPDVPTLQRIAGVLGVSVSRLLGESPEP